MKKIFKIAAMVLLMLGGVSLWANNIQITKGPQIVSRNMDNKQIAVRFNVSWDNSWNLNFPKNHDAAWIFMKYKIAANVGSDFKHAYLVQAADIVKGVSESTAPVQSYGTSKLPDGTTKTTGVFLYRKDIGHGTTEFRDAELVWDVTGTGIDENTVLSVRVFAIEMVYVPQGTFNIGDGSSANDLIVTSTGQLMRRVDYNQEKCNYPATTTTNMALSKTYAGSSGAASCFDNNTSTGASFYSYRSWQYAQVDLRGNWNVNRCVVNVVYSYYFTGFYVTASIDGSTWRTIYDQSGQTTTYRGLLGSSASGTAVVSTTHNFTYPGCYRYLRFYFYDYGAGVTGMVREIYVYGPTSSAAIPGTATNQITSASSATTWRYNNDPTGTPNASNNATNSYTNVSIPVAFPNGYNAFYVMKHELTQAAWADFLNSLSVTQQTQLSFIAPTSAEKTNLFTNYNSNLANHRMMIAMREPAEKTPAVYGCTADGENWDHEDNGGNVPMFGLAWSDVTAYLAWACLRPMTELEYEKACRGDQVRVANEYAWGNAVATPSTGIEKANKSDETPTPATGFYAFAGGTVSAHAAAVKSRWPVRAGSFAGEGTDRQDAGASYWGILNLTDNVPERVVSVGHATGRAFTGEHGYGYLTADGFAEINGWPVVNSKVVSYQFAAGNTHANGTDYRGINVTGTNTINGIQTMATRPYNNFINWRDQWTGLRGVRTAQ